MNPKDDERRNMSDKEILGRCVGLEKGWLSEVERKEVVDMWHMYKDEFSLRDEIGICENIELEIDVTYKISIFH